MKIPLLAAVPADPAPPTAGRRGIWHELREGLDLVLGNRLLRAIAGCTATSNLFVAAFSALYVLFVVRELHLRPAQLGLVFAADGPGAIAAVFLAARLARWIGLGRAILAGALGFSTANLLVPWLPAGWVLTLPILCLAQALGPGSGVLYNINQVSLRQAITPDRLQGRMGATMRVMVWGVIPIGALAGGLLGQAAGLRTALWVCALGSPLAVLPLLLSPIPALKSAPEPAF
jgi:predicted MFS family arabinose efflux permease